MRLNLQLTPDQARSIIHAWALENRMAASDRNSIYQGDREPPSGLSAWTHGLAGYMTEGQDRHRWLTADFDLGEVLLLPEGNWIYRYSGDQKGLKSFARYPVPGLKWEQLPVIDQR